MRRCGSLLPFAPSGNCSGYVVGPIPSSVSKPHNGKTLVQSLIAPILSASPTYNCRPSVTGPGDKACNPCGVQISEAFSIVRTHGVPGHTRERMMIRAIGLFMLAMCASAHAQVYRCKDPETGRSTYSQTPCNDAPSVKIMNATPSTSSGRRPSSDPATSTVGPAKPPARAFDVRKTALYKVCFEQVTGINPDGQVASIGEPDADRKIRKCMERALKKAAAPTSPPTSSNVTSSVPMPHVPPAIVTSCDPGGCWDSNGMRYSSSGAVMVRSDGKTCIQVGNMMECH